MENIPRRTSRVSHQLWCSLVRISRLSASGGRRKIVYGRTVGGWSWREIVVEEEVFVALMPELQPWVEPGHWHEVEGGQSPPSGASAATAHTVAACIGRE